MALRKILAKVEQRLLGAITHTITQDPVAALTFDDGPHPEFTPRLLDILEKYQAKATFFMVGKAAARYPKIVEQVAQAGHVIGNHTWDHASFPLLTSRERRAQIRACAEATSPFARRLFRPPFDHQNRASRLDAFWLGYQVIGWNVAAQDFLDHEKGWIFNNLIQTVRPGSIVLLHDTLYHARDEQFASRKPVFTALDAFIQRTKKDLDFITVPELFKHGQIQRHRWYQTGKPEQLSKLKTLFDYDTYIV